MAIQFSILTELQRAGIIINTFYGKVKRRISEIFPQNIGKLKLGKITE